MTDALLVKYLVGEAAEGESVQVETWISQQEDNRAYFNQFKTLWEQSRLLAPRLPVDESAAWDRFVNKLEQRPQVKPLYSRMGWWQAAAILLLVVTGFITYALIKRANAPQAIQVLADNTPVTRTLPDGSTVVLNKHASLEYPAQFNGDQRKVRMKGEGFFTVTHNAQQPFVVACAGADITVVGTAFNVNTNGPSTTVIVQEGRVRVSRNGQTILLNPGEQVVVNNASGNMEKTSHAGRLYGYYRNRVFICDATPLRQLVEALNDGYDAHIVIANRELANLPISTTFNNEPLDKILLVIAQTFNAKIENKEDSILLK